MNANELADEWKHTAFISEENKQNCGDRMATMLRQLQAENEQLKRMITARDELIAVLEEK